MPGFKRTILALLFPILCLGCGQPPLTMSTPPEGQKLDYAKVLARWTRSGKVYGQFQIRLSLKATFISPEFAAAFIQQYNNVYQPVDKERTLISNRWMNRATRNACFFLGVYTDEREWNDLALPGSIWRTYLQTDRGERFKLTAISEVDQRAFPYRHFFPYFGHFGRGYIACVGHEGKVTTVQANPPADGADTSMKPGSGAESDGQPGSYERRDMEVDPDGPELWPERPVTIAPVGFSLNENTRWIKLELRSHLGHEQLLWRLSPP